MTKLDKAIESHVTTAKAQSSLHGRDSWQAKETWQVIAWLRELKRWRKRAVQDRKREPGPHQG